MTKDTLDRIRALDPVTHEELQAATSSRDEVWNKLLTRTAQEEQVPVRLRPRRSVARRVVPVLVAASLIGGIAGTAYERSDNSRTEALGPALAFADNGSRVTITIVDLQADADRFNRELADHQLKFKLNLVPASPSVVGQVVAGFGGDQNEPGDVRVGETPQGCEVGGAAPCNITISVAKDLRGEGELVLGRPLQPGEESVTFADLGAPKEPLAGVSYQGLQVGQVRELLRQRELTVLRYEVNLGDRNELRDTVPDNWKVRTGWMITGDQVVLGVNPVR